MPPASKLTPDELKGISAKLFYIGFAFLPLVWLINAFYVYPELWARPSELDRKLTFYARGSLVGVIVWFIILTTWYAVYVTYRTSWAAGGDAITVLIPVGY